MTISESWLENYFHLATMMQNHLDSNWDNPVCGEIRDTQARYGSGALPTLCKNWTDEFEDKFKDAEWDVTHDWFGELENFFIEKNGI